MIRSKVLERNGDFHLLKGGVTLAIFKPSGKEPFSKDFSNRYFRKSFNSLKQFLRTLELILS